MSFAHSQGSLHNTEGTQKPEFGLQAEISYAKAEKSAERGRDGGDKLEMRSYLEILI
jgi:hypothetical protein